MKRQKKYSFKWHSRNSDLGNITGEGCEFYNFSHLLLGGRDWGFTSSLEIYLCTVSGITSVSLPLVGLFKP